MKTVAIQLLGLSLCLQPLSAVEKEWVFLNGQLVQVEKRSNPKTEEDSNIEWKIINGQLTKIEKDKAVKTKSQKALTIDIPDSNAQGLKSIDFDRQRDITQSYKKAEINSPLDKSKDLDLLQKELSLEEQKVILPKRLPFKSSQKLSNTDLNLWGESLVQTKKWLNLNYQKTHPKTQPSQNFIHVYQKILTQWKLDFQDYEKAIGKSSKN